MARVPALISLILVAGAVTMLFLVILAGVKDADPLNKIYFLSADTSGITNAPPVSHWTLWNVCDGSSGLNHDCSSNKAAHPFDPPRNFATTKDIPQQFLNGGAHSKYYYLSRFAFAFYIIAVFFAVLALFTGVFALSGRLGSALSTVWSLVATFFTALAAALMTAWVILGRHAFNSNNQSSTIGVKAMAFSWASVAALLIASIMFCLSCFGRRKDTTYTETRRSGGGFGAGRFWNRRRNRASVRSTRSYDSTRRVKEDY